MKSVCIQYTIRPDVDLDELKRAITEFVAGINAHDPRHRYTSFQHAEDPRRFVHIGEFVEEAPPTFQEEPFFQHFTAYLRERCASGPEVSSLERVAFTC
ncbi:MAG: hypothetical protein JWL77_5735 [Chthonomonadaceae bacterium]|nr:hypothetical protein [Chthonomonadaceae bacterium]